MKGKVIILEDDLILAKQMSVLLTRNGFIAKHTINSDLFFQELRIFKPDVVLLDVYLVGSKLNGIQVLKYLKNNLDLNYKVIVISGEVNAPQIEEIRQLGAYHLIEKGANFNINHLLLHIENAVQLKHQEEENIGLQIENINLKKQFARSFPFIGEDESVIRARSQISKLAQADEDLFLVGETGTGKEIAAISYYVNSHRFGKPLHTVNCSALTETLIESELFGHTKGTFSNTDKYKVGFFEECSEGILFLDEVTNLSLPAQSKILRSIENKEIQVVGGPLKKVNTRLIFASNSPLLNLSNPQTFRKDLFYRIEGNIVELHPLRDRGDDIILLISYFITNYSERFGFSDHSNLSELRDLLLTYSWPGNIRELKNFCKFMMINEKEINNNVIIKHLNNKIYKFQDDNSLSMNKYFMQSKIRDSMFDFERDYLTYQLNRHNWNVSQTSRTIGLERTTLYKKMKLLNIEMPDSLPE